MTITVDIPWPLFSQSADDLARRLRLLLVIDEVRESGVGTHLERDHLDGDPRSHRGFQEVFELVAHDTATTDGAGQHGLVQQDEEDRGRSSATISRSSSPPS